MASDEELFNIFQPICLNLIQEINTENLITLKRALQFVDRRIPKPLQEYILFPMRIILKTPNSKQNVLQEVLESTTLTLEKSASVESLQIFQDLYYQICFKLSNPKDFNLVADLSEEMKLAYLKCLSATIEKSNSSILQHVYSEDFLPQLAHLIVLLLQMAETEKSRSLQIASMKLLLTLTTDKNKGHRNQIAAVFASFVPKISVVLSRIALGDCVQGHAVIVSAIETWTNVVVLVMDDDYFLLSNTAKRKGDKAEPAQPANKPKLVDQNEMWWKETASNLHVLIERLSELVSHSHWKVRLSLAKWAGSLSLKCSKSLSMSGGKLLDTILVLSADEMTSVSKTSQKFLQQFADTFSTSSSFVELLKDNLHDLVTKLPRIFRNSDDAKTISYVHLLLGYIQLLGNRIEGLLLSHSHMTRLSQALLDLSKMDTSSVHIVFLKNSDTGPSNNTEFAVNDVASLPFKKNFSHFTDEKILKKLLELCRLLGRYGDLEYLVDHFLDIFNKSSVHRKEAAFVLNELVLGVGVLDQNEDDKPSWFIDIPTATLGMNTTKLPLIIKLIIDEYLQPTTWSLPVCLEEGKSRTDEGKELMDINRQVDNMLSVEKMNNNIFLLCILLEGLGKFSKVLGPDFNMFLRKILYPLLEKMGSPSLAISHTAVSVANIVAASIGHSNVKEMIYSNSDYLVDSLSLKLRYVFQYPEAPRILRVTVQNSGPNILVVMRDSVDELLNALDIYHGKKTELFMEAINALVIGVHEWFTNQEIKREVDPTISEMKTADCVPDGQSSLEHIKDYFLEYHRLKTLAEGDIEDIPNDKIDENEKDAINDEDGESTHEVKKTSPYHVQMIVQILERCVHLISHRNFNMSMLILDTVDVGILTLQSWEDDLLPMIHRLWEPTVGQFSSENLIIVRKAFSIICTMANVCGSFVSKRILTGIWPRLIVFLENQSKISYNKDIQSYHFTSAYKLQRDILSNAGILAKKLNLPIEHLDKLVGCCAYYLSCHQPKELQEMASTTFDILSSIQPDLVWLHFSMFVDVENELQRPHSCFKPFKITRTNDKVEYNESVKRIICTLSASDN